MRAPLSRSRRVSERLAIGGVVVLAATGIGAARVPAGTSASQPAALCIPILMDCSSPSPTPSPTPTDGSGSGSGGGIPPVLPGIPGTGSGSGAIAIPGDTPPPPVVAVPDDGAPIFTLPAAQLGGSSISFQGLKGVSVVTVPKLDGSRITCLKLEADDIAIKDFVIDVRENTTDGALVTNAGVMELKGHVQVYLDSATATLPDGSGLTLGANTPPPGGELPARLLRVDLGLVGLTADQISFTPVDQFITHN